jgi:UDP-N-acetylglucosamine acyltransferase
MSPDEVFVHPSAVVHPKARLSGGVRIGPYCVIGENVAIGRNTRLDSHVSITGWTEIGENCRFSPFTSIGTEPQDVGYKGEETTVKIGNDNIFKEYITVHRGTIKGRAQTTIGDRNYFMALAHVAHDCLIGNDIVFTHAGTLGGHVTIGDFATVGGYSAVHQFCRVGRYAFMGGYTVVTHDVPPFCRVAGMRPVLIYGLNNVGLRRRGFTRERIDGLKKMVRILFYSDLNTTQALERILSDCPASEDRDELANFIKSSKRGIIKKTGEQWETDSE